MALGFVIVMALFALGDAAYAGYLLLSGAVVNLGTYAIAIALAAVAGWMVYRRYVGPADHPPPG